MAATSGVTTANEERALALLGGGTPATQVASALGVTESYISQLMAREDFAAEVIKRKCETLEKHNIRDAKYDGLEDKILHQLEQTVGMVFDPIKLTRILQVANAAKRRGVGADVHAHQAAPSITLVLPTTVVERFQANAQNQVIEAGNQQLVTMQVGTLIDRLRSKERDVTPANRIEGSKDSGI